MRARVYEAVARCWPAGRPLGDAVTLSGPEPKDAPWFRSLGFPQEAQWFVDHERLATDRARELCPHSNVFHGEIGVLLRFMPPVALINLDLMKQPTAEAEALVRLGIERLSPDGVLAFTFVRAREHSLGTMRRRLLQTEEKTLEAARWAVVREIVRSTGTTEIFADCYRDRRVAMGVIAMQKATTTKSIRRSHEHHR